MSTAAQSTRRERLLTIGAVCQRLKDDFPEISISKIRYLEDQGLLTPRRTRGGYRLFSEDDVERLRRILELQRDEFLPLRVIRQELAAPSRQERKRRRGGLTDQEPELDLDELVERSGVPRDLVRELEEFGILEPRARRTRVVSTPSMSGICTSMRTTSKASRPRAASASSRSARCVSG